MPGGLAVASVFACAGFGAVSGASTATAAVFSRVAVPEMLRSGYAPSLAAGTIAVGGTLAALIPPSALLVIYAIMVEKSVGQLLIAGFIPGIISVLAYAVIIVVWAMINPSIARPIRGYTWKQRIVSLPKTTPLFGVVGIIFSAMYLGWATPTEAGALGAFLVLIVALLNGMRVLELREAVEETARLTVMIFSLIWGVLIFVRFLGFSGLPQVFTDWIVSLPVSPTVVMIMILLGYVVLGMFMDAIGMMMLTLPIVYPAVIALGYDPIWFGIVVVKMAEICLITPPIGLNCFVVASVRPDIPVNEVFRGSAPFLVAEVVTIGIFLTWPQVITWLPEQALK